MKTVGCCHRWREKRTRLIRGRITLLNGSIMERIEKILITGGRVNFVKVGVALAVKMTVRINRGEQHR
jgi:hypothetical protein